MAVAIVAIAQEYNYSKQQQGLILSAFFFGYIITPIIGGAVADRYGGKFVLAFGLAYPSIHAMIGTWAPPSERSKAVATVTAFAYSGSVIALPISSSLVVSSWGWRSIFWLFGLLGALWSLVWQIWGASDPTSCRWITEHEKNWIFQQQQLDHTTGSDPMDEALECLDQTRTIGVDGIPITYQSLQHNEPPRISEDSDSEIQATSSSFQSTSDENDLVFRADASTSVLPSEAQHYDEQSRWQAFRNKIRSKTAIRRQDLEKPDKEPVPWKKLLKRREVWAIILSQFFNSLGFFVMQSWVPTFYLDFYGEDVGKIGYYAVLPSAIQGIVGLTAGYLGDKATLDWKWTTLAVRRTAQSVGSLGLGVFLLCAVLFAPTAAVAMVLITIGMALNGFTLIGASAYQHDFCPQYAGFVFSLGNTAGSIPGLVGVFLVGILLDMAGANRWTVIWGAVCLFYVVGTTFTGTKFISLDWPLNLFAVLKPKRRE
ncbi:hypothetical protein BGZ80_007696 [Entomortierella chlamydospora]|uniref:Major facilitator superfamily (MFS) profile domain-containing protein n=1 Tax=Entomortierella chlamydospora TaxID=101097 RepID=A0A9P6MY59_9FUNG|nr:hypothetical protein BGZ80_007696 [Entomortierella chlamydospora]